MLVHDMCTIDPQAIISGIVITLSLSLPAFGLLFAIRSLPAQIASPDRFRVEERIVDVEHARVA